MSNILRIIISLWIDGVIIVALSAFLAIGSPLFQSNPSLSFLSEKEVQVGIVILFALPLGWITGFFE